VECTKFRIGCQWEFGGEGFVGCGRRRDIRITSKMRCTPTYLRCELISNLDDCGKKGSITTGGQARAIASRLDPLVGRVYSQESVNQVPRTRNKFTHVFDIELIPFSMQCMISDRSKRLDTFGLNRGKDARLNKRVYQGL
jgi:hypothetical protein